MKLPEIRDRLELAVVILSPMRGAMESDHSLELSLALGELLGNVVKTWNLVKRDMEAKDNVQ